LRVKERPDELVELLFVGLGESVQILGRLVGIRRLSYEEGKVSFK
jgi:hypothetical protein